MDRPIHDRLSINAYEKSMQGMGRDEDMATEEILTTILEQEMMEDETSPLEEEATVVEIHIPNHEAEAFEVTMDSPRGEEDRHSSGPKEGIASDPRGPEYTIPEWLKQRIQKSQQKEVDLVIELQEILDRENRLKEQGKERRYTKFIRGEFVSLW